MPLAAHYLALKQIASADLTDALVRPALESVIVESLDVINGAQAIDLVSKVAGKSYEMRHFGNRFSRPINKALFWPNVDRQAMLTALFDAPEAADPATLDRYLYTAAMSYPAANDLEKSDDKKTPGTFFEILIGFLFAARYGVNPRKSITVPTLEIENKIPTDYIFELSGNRRIHLPVKLSTRERVVQVWAHQRVLDGMHGVGRFRGILVCLTETNKQQNTSVVEVCLPGQWAAYQMYIAQLDRVYYLDPPNKYLALRDTWPHIQVWPLSRFFQEADAVTQPVNA